MKGGYRCGAGRPASRPQTSWASRLDVRKLARDGLLTPDRQTTWRWSNGLLATMAADTDHLLITYRFKFAEGEREVQSRIRLTQTPCQFGGARSWFACPRCSRRVAILYLWGYPACRTCCRMGYPSQSEDTMARSWRRTRKIETKLAGGAREWNYRRPKGMRKATFERLREAYWREEEIRDNALAEFMAVHMPGLY